MKILIGGLDYSGRLDAGHALTVERRLNEPSTCRLWISLGLGDALGMPMRNQALRVVGDDGTVYFTGYFAVSPVAEYAGLGIAGPTYRWALEAASDEVLLMDGQRMLPVADLTGAGVGHLVHGLLTRTGMDGALATDGLGLATSVSHFGLEAGVKFSTAVGQVAGLARAAYRAADGVLSLHSVGGTKHVLDEGAGSLVLANLTLTGTGMRALANDVTVCGGEEAVAYVTEYFRADGVTALYPLGEMPYFPAGASAKWIDEQFGEAEIDLRNWTFSGSEGYFGLSGAGLTFGGGTGVDGEAALEWRNPVEAAGTLLLEAVGVSLALGSTGTVAGVYSGTVLAGHCVAGFAVTAAMGTGAVSIAPLVQGAVAGPGYALDAAKHYTLRVRLHCAEMERVTQAYRVMGDGGLQVFGGGGVVATTLVQMEVQEFVNGVGGMPVVLYDGAAGYAPGTYVVTAASSVNLVGTMRSLYLASQGSAWVTSRAPGGTARTRRTGAGTAAAECAVGRNGTLTFYLGSIPVPGETIAVRYRTAGRAVGRAVNASSQAVLAAAGLPATAAWMGTVTEPAGRSSQDCRYAAEALVTAASSVSGAWSGTYQCSTRELPGDIWPGDSLLLTAASVPVSGLTSGLGLDAEVVVRQVGLEYRASEPDLVHSTIGFANEWANDLSTKTSGRVPANAWLPAVVSPTYLDNLSGLEVTAITAAAVTVATNLTAPAGGGFEVRRRDFGFRGGQDVDLVMRSVVSNFDIPRAAEAERFYVRMYDGGTPPSYSEFSAGVFLNLPLE